MIIVDDDDDDFSTASKGFSYFCIYWHIYASTFKSFDSLSRDFSRLVDIKHYLYYFQGAETNRPRFLRERKKRMPKEKQTCNVTEAAGKDVAVLQSMAASQADSCQQTVENSHDSGASALLESFSESELSSKVDRSKQNQSPLIAWKEPKRGRKIQTTSLLLRRKKKIKRRNKQKRVLRLRGGCGDEENVDEMKSSDEDSQGHNSFGEQERAIPSIRNSSNSAEPKEIQPSSAVTGHVEESPDGKRGREADDSFDVFVPVQQLKRPRGWSTWEHKRRQRPGPLQPPRVPTLEYTNMTVLAIDEEDGVRIMSQYKDKYMRSELQLERISDAQSDQRKVAGGVYRCLEKDQQGFELVIRKGFKTKTLGIVLRRRKQGKLFSLFESFGDMKYEYFRFCKHTDGLRFRQACPERTPTGYIWTGVGGEIAMPDQPSSDVFVFCERMDRDIHFSQVIMFFKGCLYIM